MDLRGSQDVSLQWDRVPDTNVTGYALYLGSASGNYSSRIDVGTNTTSTLSGLTNGGKYFFAATAYNSAKVESVPSNEAQFVASNNNPPTLNAISNRTVNVFTHLIVTNKASDPDVTNHITFSLDAGAPTNMFIDPVTGLLDWVPQLSDGGTTNAITVRVTDNGVPPASAVQTFTVVVGDFVQLSLGSPVTALGQTNAVTIGLNSSAPVTNLTFVLDVPGDRMTNLAIQSLVPSLATVTQQSAGSAHTVVTLKAVAGKSVQGPLTIAQLSFKAVAGKPSSFAMLHATNVTAVLTNGHPVPTALGVHGEAVLVGSQSLMHSRMGTNGQHNLMLYGPTGSNYMVQSRIGLTGAWTNEMTSPMMTTNLSQGFTNVARTLATKYYRAKAM